MHYLVMVIGENVEDQMEAFAQDLEVEEYLVDIVTEHEKTDMMKYYERDGKTYASFDECYEKNGKDWNWGAWRKDEDGVWREYSTSNPDAHWDWYEIGGRWAGKIVVKDGVEYIKPSFSWGWSQEEKDKVLAERRADTALLKDIDNVDKLTAYAVVRYGEWIDNGYEDLPNERVQEILSELDPDTRITFVDCHY